MKNTYSMHHRLFAFYSECLSEYDPSDETYIRSQRTLIAGDDSYRSVHFFRCEVIYNPWTTSEWRTPFITDLRAYSSVPIKFRICFYFLTPQIWLIVQIHRDRTPKSYYSRCFRSCRVYNITQKIKGWQLKIIRVFCEYFNW